MTDFHYDELNERISYKKNGKTYNRKANLQKEDFDIRLHVICQELQAPNTFLPDICTGENWRPSLIEFFSLIEDELLYRKKYKHALQAKLENETKTLLQSKSKEEMEIAKEAVKIITSSLTKLDAQTKHNDKQITFNLNSPYCEDL